MRSSSRGGRQGSTRWQSCRRRARPRSRQSLDGRMGESLASG
jgi:hypothetical protein